MPIRVLVNIAYPLKYMMYHYPSPPPYFTIILVKSSLPDMSNKVNFWLRQLIAFPILAQLCFGCQGEES